MIATLAGGDRKEDTTMRSRGQQPSGHQRPVARRRGASTRAGRGSRNSPRQPAPATPPSQRDPAAATGASAVGRCAVSRCRKAADHDVLGVAGDGGGGAQIEVMVSARR